VSFIHPDINMLYCDMRSKTQFLYW